MFLRDAAGRDASLVPQDFRPRPFGPPKNGSRPVPSRGRDRGTRPVPFRPVPPSNPGYNNDNAVVCLFRFLLLFVSSTSTLY